MRRYESIRSCACRLDKIKMHGTTVKVTELQKSNHEARHPRCVL